MKFQETEVFNFKGALRGMRNPLESWHKSDTEENVRLFCLGDNEISDGFDGWQSCNPDRFVEFNPETEELSHNGDLSTYIRIGTNDMDLAQRLILAGKEHSKFMRQILVCVDITAPLYWWSEADTYKVGTVANSTSTMHKIMSKAFQADSDDMFELNGMRGYKKKVLQTPNEIDEDTEVWREFPLNADYFVSSQGRVKRKQITTQHNRTWKERILTNTLTSDNYLKVGIKLHGEQTDIRVHRLVVLTFIPNPDMLPEVNHKNGNKLDNRLENLEWCTSSDNQQHAVDNGLQPIHITTYKGKLSKEQRDEIISKYNNEDISKRELAKLYEVSHTTINALLNNKYNYGEGYDNEYQTFLKTIDELNELRDEWLITKDKEVWKTLIEKLPRNWLQTRTVTMSYANLRDMYFQRRNHKLIEWSVSFIDWIKSLPYAIELIMIEENKKVGGQN